MLLQPKYSESKGLNKKDCLNFKPSDSPKKSKDLIEHGKIGNEVHVS